MGERDRKETCEDRKGNERKEKKGRKKSNQNKKCLIKTEEVSWLLTETNFLV